MKEQTRDSFDEALDSSLARSFPIPSDPAAFLAERPANVLPAVEHTSLFSRGLVLALAAAAAVLLLVFARFNRHPDQSYPSIVPEVGDTLLPVREPNLAALYYEVSTAIDDPFHCRSLKGLADELATNYDCCEELRLHPNVSDLLEGPFDSSLWPGGMILTGTADDTTAVLVAELGSTYSCCVRPQLPEEGELEVFTVQLGDLVLTEITPLAEPRLLDYFAWGEELR